MTPTTYFHDAFSVMTRFDQPHDAYSGDRTSLCLSTNTPQIAIFTHDAFCKNVLCYTSTALRATCAGEVRFQESRHPDQNASCDVLP